MRKRLILVAIATALLLLVTSGLSFAQPPGNTEAPDRILVKFKTEASEKEKDEVHQRHGGKAIDIISGIDVQVVQVPKGKGGEKIGNYLREARVEFAEPDFIARAIFTPDDPSFANQWGLTKIQAPQAWDITQGSASIKIAILDTGIDQDHEDLAARILANRNFTFSPTADDLFGHGTHVAGIAAAITNNSVGIAGTGFSSSLMNGKVLDDDGSGYYSWVSQGITWAADNGARVINMSLGGPSGSRTLQSAVDYAWKKGVVLVAAAGNNGSSARSYPAYYTNSIAVAATDQNDARASFSNFGKWVDIAAPGVDIFSTMPNHSNYAQANYGKSLNYDYWAGTSMATPFVAGVAALTIAAHPTWSNSQVRNQMESSGDPTTGFNSTIKRVNALNSVSGETQTTEPPPKGRGKK